MNSDLQAIMKRRRQLAEAKKSGGGSGAAEDLEGSIGDLQGSASDLHGSRSNISQGSINLNGSKSWDPNASQGSAMSGDLQAIMERRRRLADGEPDEPANNNTLSPDAIKEDLKNVEMSPDLQSIMARRRRLAEDKKAEANKSARRKSSSSKMEANEAEAEELRHSRRSESSATSRTSRSGVPPAGAPPPPPPPVHEDVSGHDSVVSDHSSEASDQERRKRSSKKSSRPSSSRKSRSRKEEIIAPVELDIDEDSEEEDNEEEPEPEPEPEEAKVRKARRPRKSGRHEEDPEEMGSPLVSPRRKSRHARHDTDDMSVDQSVDLSIDSKGSNKSGETSPKRGSSSRSVEKRTGGSGSSSRQRDDRGDSNRGKQSRRRSTTASSRLETEADKHKRRSRRSSTSTSGAGASSSRRTMRRSASNRSMDSDDGAAPPGSGSRRPVTQRASTRSIDSDDIEPPESEKANPTSSPQKAPRKKSAPVAVELEMEDDGEGGGEAAWGDFPATAAPKTTEAKESGFSSGFADFSGGMDFGASVANFASSEFVPSVEATDMKMDANAFSADATFDAAFSSTPAMDSNAFASSSGFGSAAAAGGTFEEKSMLVPAPAPVAKVWDSSPLSNVPKTKPTKLSLVETAVLPCELEGTPVTNPLNGNVIFCSAKDGALFIREVDPHRDNVQVSSVAVLSPDLQHKMASKYNTSAHGVDSVVALAAGMHRSHGQTRVRVAAILDLNVLESNEVKRTVAVWQWGYGSPHPVLLQYVMAPPSGGDFSYDATSLQLADGLLFIAGTSPKGPCVFMSKPAVRETWSANFLAGKGRISAMAISSDTKRSFPHIAIAFTDKTVSVWTFAAALSSGASKGNEAAKKWLFPSCRLDAQSTLAKVAPTPLSPTSAGGKGTMIKVLQ